MLAFTEHVANCCYLVPDSLTLHEAWTEVAYENQVRKFALVDVPGFGRILLAQDVPLVCLGRCPAYSWHNGRCWAVQDDLTRLELQRMPRSGVTNLTRIMLGYDKSAKHCPHAGELLNFVAHVLNL